MKRLFYITKGVTKVFAWIVAGLLAIMMFMVSFDCIGRYVFDNPIPGTLEISESIIVITIFLTAAYCELKDDHIRVTFVVNWFPKKIKNILYYLSNAISVIYFATLSWQSWKIGLHAYSINETSWGSLAIPLYPAKFSISIGCALFCIVIIMKLFPSFSDSENISSGEPVKAKEGV